MEFLIINIYILIKQNSYKICPIRQLIYVEIKIQCFTDYECFTHFRFKKKELIKLYNGIKFPIEVVQGRNTIKSEESFLFLLYRLSHSNRLIDAEDFFQKDYSQISRGISWCINWINNNHSWRMSSLEFWKDQFSKFKEAIELLTKIETNVICFIDGTLRTISRPRNENIPDLQRYFYSDINLI